jgi:hypothetical protein
MGIVYRARDTVLGRPVALKVLPPDHAADPVARQRFLREAKAVAALRHDHIVVIYQAGEHGDTLYLAMEMLEGETLANRLRRQGPLPLREVLRWARELAAGLAAAHGAGLVHRDVKPGNLWIEEGPGRSPPGRLKILDFGLARPAAPVAALTQSGMFVGTLGYLSPEQAGGEAVDHRSDLFSLGCVLYQMLTGVAPFERGNSRAVLRAILFETPRPPGELRPDVPPPLNDLVECLLAKKPQDRPQSAEEVSAALHAIEAELPAAPTSAGATAPRGGRRPRPRPILAALLGLVILAVAGVAFSAARARLFHPAGAANPDVPTPPVTQEPAPPTGPFLLVAGAGGPPRPFATLAAAAAAAHSGDAVEVHGDGPFPCDAIDLESRDLTIRAATGSRPRLEFGRPGEPATGFLLSGAGKLVLEGLELHRFATASSPGSGLVRITPPGRLHVAHCRFVVEGPGMAVQAEAATLRVLHSEFLLSGRTWWGLQWSPARSVDVRKPRGSVEGCVFFSTDPGTAYGLQLHYPAALPPYSLAVQKNTFFTTWPLSIRFGPQSRETTAAAGKTGQMVLAANVFVGRYSMVVHQTLPEWHIMPAGTAADLYPAVLDWQDRDNVYARGVPLFRALEQPNPFAPQREIESLTDWQQWLGVKETSSVQGDIRFAEVLGEETDLEKLRPTGFRLAEGSAGRKAGPGGRDLGADVDAVGLGTAYEAWKQTPDYRQWLRDTQAGN